MCLAVVLSVMTVMVVASVFGTHRIQFVQIIFPVRRWSLPAEDIDQSEFHQCRKDEQHAWDEMIRCANITIKTCAVGSAVENLPAIHLNHFYCI